MFLTFCKHDTYLPTDHYSSYFMRFMYLAGYSIDLVWENVLIENASNLQADEK